MRRDILSTFLLLVGVSVFAQPGVTEPNFNETKDAKLIFSQDFESDWETWTTTPVNTITQVEYYRNEGKSSSNSLKPWENPNQWQRGLFRDTLINLYNGVVITDGDNEKWCETVENDSSIVHDNGSDKQMRNNAMAAFGESDLGGDSYFKFVTDSAPKSYRNPFYYSTSTGLSARYVRYLAVQGLDLEELSSYRLTFYVKAKALEGHEEVTPTMYADVMRGLISMDKPLSMGFINDPENYQYNNKFEYTKKVFNGDWEKVTYMTYYLTDSVAENFVFADGYWWAEDSAWFWSKNDVNNTLNKDLFYAVQPENFYVRIGFASNYTEFLIDNLSLIKSTIGGIEYYQDKMRVDFGYETNLRKLAIEEYKKTRIDAIEIPNQYYEVWGLLDNGQWERVNIATAEYHGDGYMYLFTDYYVDPQTGESVKNTLDNYRKVLVSFTNPTEEELELKYTGTLFPNAIDVEWIKAGKRVLDFNNEEAKLNPYVFENVYSIGDRPPVMQKALIESGSFGLDGSIRELKFKFSREMAIDNPSNVAQREKCLVYVNEEIWDRSWYEADSMLILTRPSKYTAPLNGDYVIEINNIYIPNTQTKGDDVTIHYNFGSINRDLSDIEFDTPIWDAMFYDRSVNFGPSRSQPAGTAATYNSGWGAGTSNLEIGDGKTKKNAARLYFYDSEETKYPKALCLSQRGNGTAASLYLGYGEGYEINLGSGSYVVKFAAASVNNSLPIRVYVLPYGADPRTVDAAERIKVGEYTFTSSFDESIRNSASSVLDTLMTDLQFGFSVEKTGRYLIQIEVAGGAVWMGNYHGVMLSNIELFNAPVCYNPIRALNDAVAAAQARVAQAADAKYSGDAKTTLNTLISRYRIDSSFTSSKPSDWYAAANETKNATKALGCRMDAVDMVVDKISEVAQKLTQVATDNADWTDLIDYKALQSTKTTADSYNYSVKSNADLVAFIGLMDEQMAVLDQRIKDNRLFDIEFTKAKALLSNTEQVASQELETLQSVCNNYEGFDAINTTDQQLSVAIREVSGASYAYSYLVYIGKIGPRRVNELAALANALGSTITENESVSNRLSNLKNDDDDLADILKAAIKVAIYEKICNGDNVNNLDLSPFIKNYYLYATPIVAEEMDLRMPENRYDLRYSEDRHGNANVAHTRHQYLSNNKPIWMILNQHPFDNLLPGWTISAGNGDGNDITLVDSLDAKGDNTSGTIFKSSNFEEGRAVFDGAISMDWGGEAYLSSNVIGLPAGEYELGLDVRSCYDNINKSSRGNGVLRVTTDAQISETPLITGWLLEETILVPSEIEPGEFVEASNTANCDTTIFTSVNFTQSDNKGLMIDAIVKAANGCAQIDNFKLTFNRDYNFNYSAALADARAQLNRLLADGPENIYNNVYQESISADAGSQVTIPIKMLNRNSITAFSFDVILPSGISFVRAQLANERANSHSISANVRYGSNQDTVSIACISLENKTFYGNDGAIVNLMVDVANDIEGDFSMLIDNIELVASATQVYNPQSFTGNITVLPVYTVGDVNEDSNISMMDAVGVVAFLTNSDVQGLDHHAADANCDGAINEDDANLIANYVIGNDEARAQLGEFSNGTANAPTEGTYRIYIDDLTTDEGSQLVIPIKMKNVSSVTAYSFDVTLPLGVTFQSAELVGSRTDGHTLFRNYKKYWNNNIVSFACISLQNNTYSSGDDAVINLTVNVAEDVEGIVDITIGNIEMAVSATLAYNPEDYTGSLTVNAVFDPADVNKDGKISIADAVGVVSFIINSDIQGLDRHAADANQDGTIDVTDVVWIINRVIGKSYAPSRRPTSTEISSTLALDYVLNTTSSSLSVTMEGLLNEITAVQFNVTLPSGLNLKKFSTSDTHMFASNRQDDGSYTVVCFSLTNSTFVGGGERVFEVEFDLDDSFQSAPVTLNNIKLVTPDCRTKTIDSLMISLSGSGPETGIIGVNDDSEFNLYDLQGRQIDKGNGIFIRDNKKMMQAK